MFTALFWKDTFERMITTAAQVLIALMTVDGFNLIGLDWVATASTVGIAVILSFLKAVVAVQATGDSVSPASLASDRDGRL